MLRTVAGPYHYLVVLFLFQGPATMFCNESFVPHVCLFPPRFVRLCHCYHDRECPDTVIYHLFSDGGISYILSLIMEAVPDAI